MSRPNTPWSATTPQTKPRPATINEGFGYPLCFGNEQYPLSPWNSPAISLQQTPSDTVSRPISMDQDFMISLGEQHETWPFKQCHEQLDSDWTSFDQGLPIGQAVTSDEAIPVFDLTQPAPMQNSEALRHLEGGNVMHRTSGSSFTMSNSGAPSDMTSYEEFSAALSDVPSYCSDIHLPPSNRTSLLSSTQLSPAASPHLAPQGRSEFVVTQSRTRGATPSPRPSARSAPYKLENSRSKRWSTGTYGRSSSRRSSPFPYHAGHDAVQAYHNNLGTSLLSGTSDVHSQGILLPSQVPPQMLTSAPTYMPPTLPSQPFDARGSHCFQSSKPPLSQGLLKMLQSNGDRNSCHSHAVDLSDPPDLFASLQEEQLQPPPEDMDPEDRDLVPREQDLRFQGDLYTPRWVRGHGNKREGWCGICKPGRWLVLKNSAFWYDKSFSHGISAATGNPFPEPQDTRRMHGNQDVWEGLCGGCHEWIALVSSKKKGTTWFRHAYKCLAHQKSKDGSKRRRDAASMKALAASSAKLKLTQQQSGAQQLAARDVSVASDACNTSGVAATTMQSHCQQPLNFSSSQPFHYSLHEPPANLVDCENTYPSVF